jgi:hypothetical protein
MMTILGYWIRRIRNCDDIRVFGLQKGVDDINGYVRRNMVSSIRYHRMSTSMII